MTKSERTQLSEDEKKLTNEQTYDSALAAMVSKLKAYVVPLVNEVFGEQFSEEAEVLLRNNKHVIRRTDNSLARRDSDAVIELTEAVDKLIQKIYMFECETWFDKSIVLRIAEYSSSVAIENAEFTDDGVLLSYPNSAVIFLRPNRKTPSRMRITHRGPNGDEMSYFVPSLQIKNYTVDDIFRKKLLILLPFYLFRFANDLDEMETNQEKRNELAAILVDINVRLETLMQSGDISAYQKLTIQSLLLRVSDRLVALYDNIKKEVDKIMSGAIARTQADDILEQGLEQGQNETIALINFLFANGKNEEAHKALNDPGFFREILRKFKCGELTEDQQQ